MNEKIAEVILEMVSEDQKIRMDVFDEKLWFRCETRHFLTLTFIIELFGWPTISKVGREASSGAWLLVQHADRHLAFQKKCLALMVQEPEHEVSEVNIAYQYDRICVNELQPQFFGTQFTTNTYGAYGPQPIEDIDHVDERRSLIGLNSLSEYKKELALKYGI